VKEVGESAHLFREASNSGNPEKKNWGDSREKKLMLKKEEFLIKAFRLGADSWKPLVKKNAFTETPNKEDQYCEEAPPW